MPNYVLSKGATPMNQHFEITMFTSKFCMDFAVQNPFKVWSTQPDTTRYQFFIQFALKKQCTAKSTQAFESMLHAEPYTLEKSYTFKDKCS